MVELIHKRGWDSKTFDTGKKEKGKSVLGAKLQNGLHDIEPDGSFVDCDMTIETIVNGVTTHQVKRGRYGELRFGDNSSENKHLCKIKYKNGNGISLKYLGADSGSPIINGDVKFAAADGIQLRHLPTYKGVKIELITDDPLTAPLEYAFSVKAYGQNYTYEIIDGSIIATGEDGKIITIHAPYAVDANDDTGQVRYELLGIVDEYQLFKKVVDEVWLRQAVAPVRIDPNVAIDDDSGTFEDAYISSPSVNNNYGARDLMIARNVSGTRDCMLMKADLSDYLGATVIAARFGLDIYDVNNPIFIRWHRVLIPWGEGVGNDVAATAGECSFNHSEEPTTWTTAGCLGDGTDRQAVEEGNAVIPSISSDYHLDLTTATGQAWLDDVAVNHGIMVDAPVFSHPERILARSSETVTGNKPYFYMEYTEGGGEGFFFFNPQIDD